MRGVALLVFGPLAAGCQMRRHRRRRPSARLASRSPSRRRTTTTASGCSPLATTRAAGTATSRRSRPPTRRIFTSRGRSPRACCAATRGSRSSSTRRCTSSRRTRTWRTRSISRSRAFREVEVPAGERAGGGRRGVLRRRESRRVVREREDRLQPARRTHRRRRRRDGHGALEGEDGGLNRGETITMAPIVVKDKVIVGSSGGEMGVRGWIAALDLATGKQLWRAYNLGPDADMKVGPRFKPFYPQDRSANSGTSSWPGDSWKVGGARCGDGSRTIPSSTSSITARRIPVRGTAISGQATTSGAPRSSRAMPTRAR